MRIGFTGSSEGMTEQEKQTLIRVLQEYRPVEFTMATEWVPRGIGCDGKGCAATEGLPGRFPQDAIALVASPRATPRD
jgi:hypothetical protein